MTGEVRFKIFQFVTTYTDVYYWDSYNIENNNKIKLVVFVKTLYNMVIYNNIIVF